MSDKLVIMFLLVTRAMSAAEARAQAPQKITLDEAKKIALANHPQIHSIQFAASAAEKTITEARSAYFPNAFGSVTGAGALDKSRIAAGGLNNPIIFDRNADGVMVTQLLTDFGRTPNLVASARLHAQARVQDVATTRAEVLLGVTRAYYAVLRNMAILKVARETVTGRQLVADQVGALAKSKLKSDVDVSFSGVNLAEAKLFLVRAQNELKASYAELSAAMGYSGEPEFEPADAPLHPTPMPKLYSAVSEAMRNRPELASARLRSNSAEQYAKAESDLWRPSISAAGAAGIIPLHDNNLLNRYAALGLNINIPIFNGHLFSARSAEAKLNSKAEEQNLLNLQNQIARDVRVA